MTRAGRTEDHQRPRDPAPDHDQPSAGQPIAGLAHLVTTDPFVAADRLGRGGVAALPTETVYGLAADATNDAAIQRVFEIKGRPGHHPLILHFDRPEPLEWVEQGWVDQSWCDSAGFDGAPRSHHLTALADALWPGPLTVIVGAGRRVSSLVTGGRDTVGIRVPAQADTARALGLLGRPVAAPSANRFGKVSPTRVSHVLDDIAALLIPGTDIILDGGPAPCGVESTIVDLAADDGRGEPQILRHGAVDEAEIVALVGAVTTASGPARSSGMLAAHYAPNGFVALVDDTADAEDLARRYRRDGLVVEVIDRSSDPAEAARCLYADLRRADRSGTDGVVVVAPPPIGIGIAVRDRLRRAATGSAPPNPTS